MGPSNPGIVYIFLIIPTFFALAMAGQGIYKITKNEEGGGIPLTFGIICFVLIGISYFFFIR